MKSKRKLLSIIITSLLFCGLSNCTSDKEKGIVERIKQLDEDNQVIVQLAELVIDSTQLEPYLKLLKEGIQTSVNEESGVLTLYAMAEQNNPTKITVLEIYADEEAYKSHIASAHFKKYKTGSIKMVDSLKITRTKPIVFAAKSK